LPARMLLAVGCALIPCVAAPGAPANDEVVPGAPAPQVAAPVAVPEPALESAVQGLADTAGGTAAQSAAESAMIATVNRARAARGLRPLRFSPSLSRSAHRYAAWMLRRDYFGHLREIRASRRFRRLGETLAMHFGRRAQVRGTVRRWLRSPAHRSLLLSGRFRALGAGRATGVYRGHRATTWVLHLGA
jgi:uncharacterized protein YkwD